MDIQHNLTTSDINAFSNQFLSLSLTISHPQNLSRSSNTLIAGEMLYETNPDHIQQYNKLYLDRLANLSKRVPFNKSYKIQEVEGRLGTINIIGIFKRIQFKRVRAFEKGFEQFYENCKKIYDEKDSLQVEDATGKLKFKLMPGAVLNGRQIRTTDLPYGIIIGLTGKYCEKKMQFQVNKLTLPSLPIQKPFRYQTYTQSRKSLIVSSPSVQQLKTILKTICMKNQMAFSNSIKSLIIMGFSEKMSANSYRELDDSLQKYKESIDIYLMPNHSISQIYPQKPIHPILFRKSYHKINLVSNPQIFYLNTSDEDINYQTLSGSILVSSGQNIKDLVKNCSDGQSSLDSMQSIIQYSHLAPTCPFSMKCQMMPEDYLVLRQLPYVFVAGECEKTEARDFLSSDKSKKVRLIAVKAREMILLDIDSHEVQNYIIQQNFKNLQEIA